MSALNFVSRLSIKQSVTVVTWINNGFKSVWHVCSNARQLYVVTHLPLAMKEGVSNKEQFFTYLVADNTKYQCKEVVKHNIAEHYYMTLAYSSMFLFWQLNMS